MKIQDFLARLQKCHETGANQWQARCPAHDDETPSLSVSLRDRKILLHCHAGCRLEEIVSALGLTMTDLFEDTHETSPAGSSKIYKYRDEQGNLLFQVVRTASKGFFQRKLAQNGGWINNTTGVRKVLYRLPELMAADLSDVVFVVEGEKDVDRLTTLGLIATTNAGGAGKWRAEHSESLRNRSVAIIPDNDEVGYKHARQVADSLLGIAASVKIVSLPDAREKGDVSDYLDAGHTNQDLLELVADTSVGTPAPVIEERQAHHTDLGNAKRLVALHGRDLRYCHVWGKWLCWDGQRWALDETGEAMRRATDTVRSIYEEASTKDDSADRRAIAEHARRSESESRIRAMIALARSEPGIPIRPGELDADPWKLNVANGTLDLRTGQLLPHSREDLLTKLAPVTYDSDALCPRWDRFLERIFNQDHDLISFVRRAVGYALTGSTREQVFFLLYGAGANGKSTLLEVLRSLLCDYAKTAEFHTFLQKARSGVSNDLARLAGARLVTAQEAEREARLAEALVKQMTGGDTVQARFLYTEHFEFRPAFKLFLAANHKPEIRGTDHAIWRRTRMVPFAVTIPEEEQDTDLVEKLKDELTGILAWAMRGCLEWQREGLGTASAVATTTNEYREESDILGAFLAECCVLGNTEEAIASDIYVAYTRWANRNGEQPLSQTSFGRQLGERGLAKRKTSGRNVWVGIGLVDGEGRDSLDGVSEKSHMREFEEIVAERPSNHPRTIPNEDTDGASEQGQLGTVGRVRHERTP